MYTVYISNVKEVNKATYRYNLYSIVTEVYKAHFTTWGAPHCHLQLRISPVPAPFFRIPRQNGTTVFDALQNGLKLVVSDILRCLDAAPGTDILVTRCDKVKGQSVKTKNSYNWRIMRIYF